jgi:hemolysin III
MPLLKAHRNQTLIEEIINATTHGIGAILSIIAMIMMIVAASHHQGEHKLLASIIFGSSLILTYSASTLYHSFSFHRLKRLFKIIDHASIYLLIAGSYTPFMLVSIDNALSHQFFFFIWGLALAGVIYKVFFIHASSKISISIYLIMGWLAILLSKSIYQHLPLAGIYWLVAGGLSYTGGVIFYVWKRLYFNHALWHLFVLTGSACHFICVYNYVL